MDRMKPDERARNSASDAVEFERYALALLRAEAVSQGKTLLAGNELPRDLSFADAMAPAGILEYSGPCFIEVKLRITEQVFRWAGKAVEANEDATLVLVTQDDRRPWDRVLHRLGSETVRKRVHIIDKRRLDELAQKHPAAALAFSKGSVERAVSSFRTQTSDSRALEQHLNSLRSAYNDDRLVLFLGAGVSKSADFPDWPELVRRLAATVFDNHSGIPLSVDERNQVQKFFESEVPASPLIVARLLRSSLRGGFAEAVRRALYRDAPPEPRSSLLEALGALCMPPRERQGIFAVVTYNFDDLLERELSRRSIAHRPIIGEGDKALRSELPIYHVHGHLPRGDALTLAHQRSLVLSEDAYHTQFVDPFIWTNITQLNLLRNAVCLFVGMSMTDPNQRRLLEIAASKDASVRHYAILKDHWTGTAARQLSANAQSLARVFKGLEEASLTSLGVTTLWVNDYPDMPALIDNLRRRQASSANA